MMTINKSFKIAIVCVFISGCGDDDSVTDITQPVNDDPPLYYAGLDTIQGIPLDEFLSVQPPSYIGFFEIYNAAIDNNPNLINSETDLAEELFNVIKSQQGISFDSPIPRRFDMLDVLQALTPEELAILFLNLQHVSKVANVPSTAVDVADSSFPCDDKIAQDNSKLNAFQHAYWMALMSKRVNPAFANSMGIAHERPSVSEESKAMDLRNNSFGIQTDIDNPEATEEQLKQILLTTTYTQVNDVNELPDDYSGLVYYVNSQPLDGRFTGTMTNPDIGVVWNANFDFVQCGADIRGSAETFFGEFKGTRRFTGTWSSGIMELQMTTPFDFELPPGTTPCQNQAAIMSGNEQMLSGSWTADNCPQGGEINVSR